MSIVTTFIIGLLGLGILVFIHEAGHFFACKLVGIEVEAFALGWGKPIYRKKWKGTEYRISMFPVGGYCKMKGEELFKKAIEENRTTVEKEEGSMFSASPLKLVFVYLAGPLANLVTAILMFSIIWFAGYTIESQPAKIVLYSEFNPGEILAADRAGLETGDIITSIDGEIILNYSELRNIAIDSPDKPLKFTVLRNGQEQKLTVVPELVKGGGIGRIGVYAWIDPLVSSVKENSPAAEAGLKPGDLITAVNGKAAAHVVEIDKMISESRDFAEITYIRDNTSYTADISVFHDLDGNLDSGIYYKANTYSYRESNPFRAIAKGTVESFETLGSALSKIGLIFKGGIKLKDTVASPIRISWMIGDNTKEAFKSGLGDGLTYFLRLLSIISIILFFSNLLPIPALDGGMILFNVIGIVTRKPINPRIFYRYNLFGFFIIIAIIVLALINDITFFSNF